MFGGGKLWIGLVLTAGLLALFLLTVDVGKMYDALAGADYVWVAPAVALYLVSLLFRTMRWRILLAHMKSVGVGRLYPVVVVGYMANNILPMRLGELVRSYYVGQREGVSRGAALATIMVERVMDALMLLVFIIVSALLIPLGGVVSGLGEWSGIAWPLLVAGATVPFVGVFGGMVAVARHPDASRRIIARAAGLLPPRGGQLVSGLGDRLIMGLEPLRSVRAIAVLFVLSAPVWLLEAGLFYLIAISFDLQHVLGGYGGLAIAAVLVTAIANIGSSVPAAPGGIGLFELVARETLVLLPLGMVDRAVAGAYAGVVHAALLLPMIALGQAYLWIDHLSLRRLWRLGEPMADKP